MSSTSLIDLNCVVLGDGPDNIFSIKIEQNEKVTSLKRRVAVDHKNSILDGIPYPKFSLFNVNLSGYHKLNLDDFKTSIQRAILDKEVMPATRKIRTIFPSESLEEENIHVVILPPLEMQERTKDNIRGQALFQLLKLEVLAFGSWSGDDVTNNNGQVIKPGYARPPPLAFIEEALAKPRTYTPPQPPDTGDMGHRMVREKYETHFQKVFLERNSSMPFVSVQEDREFVAFFNVLECFREDSNRIREDDSSSLKASQVTVYFITPPFFSSPCDAFEYKEQKSLGFPIFLSQLDQPDEWCKYTPTPNFMVTFTGHKSKSTSEFQFSFPLLTSEVVSESDESDRARILLQAIAFAQAGQFLMKRGERFYVVAIYLRANMIAERYVAALGEEPEDKDKARHCVLICQKDFNLCDPSDAVSFLQEMYNLVTMFKELAGRFDPEKMISLDRIHECARGLLSLTEMKRNKEPDDIAKSASGSFDESEPGGTFDADDIQAILKEAKYKITLIPFGHPQVAMVSNVIDGSKTGFLKFVRDGRKEILILQYLSELDSPRNHTISGIRIWPVNRGKVISMPSAGSWLTSLRDPDAHLWSAASQLFEAVDFMHQHGVAHLDLKPANVLIPLNGGRLSVIDFHTSIRIESVKTMLHGRVGTPEYMPPEVASRGLFSALRADLWSCGKTLSELCYRCSPSPDRKVLLQIARELLDRDPEKRPMMSDVLQRMADYKADGEG